MAPNLLTGKSFSVKRPGCWPQTLCVTSKTRRMFMTVLPSLVYEKLPSIVRLECLFLFFTVAAADQSGALSFPSFNIGSGLINLAALTALIGSSTVESLVLGSRGTAGLPWAAMSSFGVISVVKASLTGLSPAWLRETLGVRSALSDSFLGMSLDLRRDWRGETRIRRQIGQAAGVLCKRRAVSCCCPRAKKTKSTDPPSTECQLQRPCGPWQGGADLARCLRL